MKQENIKTEQKGISFRKLALETLPEIWGFQILASLMMVVPAGILMTLLNSVAEAGDGALTSADLRAMFLSWRTPLLLVLGFALILLYTVVEIFAQIYMNGDVLSGERIRTWREIKKGLRPAKRFLNPTGILVLLYIFIAAPLCGIGFSISLTKSFYIPNFIMDVVLATPLYAGLYAALILVLIWIGYRSIFILHGVLLDDMNPAEARKASAAIVKKNGKRFAFGMLKTLAILALVQGAVYILFRTLPDLWLAPRGSELPNGYFFDVSALDGLSSLSKTDFTIVSYRVLCAATILVGGYLVSITSLLCGSYLMLRLTMYYLEFTGGESELWPARPKKSRFPWKLQAMIVVFVMILLGSVAVGLFYNQLIEREEPVKIVAHRAGGTMALENSIEGLKLAIEHGCYGSEIDIQKTKDGRYVVNHDKTFKRLTGVNRAPKDMTLAEVRELRIRDAKGGANVPVATLEEMLETIKGKEKLFIELKGVTADRRMVDDTVAIVRAHDCVSDVVLISLNYDIIKYAETNYPEFETGALFFMGLGDISKLKCDLLIMEEEMATETRIMQIHQAGKQAIAWTVNTEKGMRAFLTSNVDAIITDEITLAEKVQAKLDERTDLEVMEDWLSEAWY